LVIEGDPDYGKDEEHQWPRAWYGVKGYFRWLQSKAYKMHVRVLLSRYRAYIPCSECKGKRFQPETLLYRLAAPVDLQISGHSKETNKPADLLAGSSSSALEERAGEKPSVSSARTLEGTEKQSDPIDRYAGISLADFYQLP